MAQSAARLERLAQQATESRAKRQARSVLHHSLMVDSTFKQSGNVAITRDGEFEQLLLACSEGCGLCYNSIGSKFGASFICASALY